MEAVQTKLMTAEEFYEWANHPENRDRYCELVRGEIVEMSRPGKLHGLVCANMVRILGNYTIAKRKGYVCSNDTGVITERDPDTVRGPDITVFEDAASYEDVDLKYGEEPPLVAVEVLSPNDVQGKVNQRIVEQLTFGTPLVWLLDPIARNITVFRPGNQPYVLTEGGMLTGEDVLPGFCCGVAECFSLPKALPRPSPKKPPRTTKPQRTRKPKK